MRGASVYETEYVVNGRGTTDRGKLSVLYGIAQVMCYE
jgi:hypothetical protein